MRHLRPAMVIGVVIVVAVLGKVLVGEYLDLDFVRRHQATLAAFVERHYVKSVALFVALFIGTAFFLPGALALTVAGGILFGTLPSVAYVNLGATLGATLAFIASRRFLGRWFQKRFQGYLQAFNREMEHHGYHYLLILRLFPIVPFFAVNYCAGITRIPLKTFVWTTSLGVLPGSFLYSFAGRRIMEAASGGLDSRGISILLAVLLLALLLPLVVRYLRQRGR